MKVFVYFNLHKKCFSVKALEGERKGRVIAHKDEILIYKPTFKVSEAGRQRVLREKRKNVHAGVVGEWLYNPFDAATIFLIQQSSGAAVMYNPYKYDSFVYKATEQKVDGALRVAALHCENGRATIHVEKALGVN
jgi:hypothetical protein